MCGTRRPRSPRAGRRVLRTHLVQFAVAVEEQAVRTATTQWMYGQAWFKGHRHSVGSRQQCRLIRTSPLEEGESSGCHLHNAHRRFLQQYRWWLRWCRLGGESSNPLFQKQHDPDKLHRKQLHGIVCLPVQRGDCLGTGNVTSRRLRRPRGRVRDCRSEWRRWLAGRRSCRRRCFPPDRCARRP